MFISSDAGVPGLGIFESETTPSMDLGARIKSDDGRVFRYVKAGGTALVAGKLQQSPAEITDHQGLTPVAASIGATTVTVTLGSTAVTANQYAQGFLVVASADGAGYSYKISSHPAADASATVVLTLEDALIEAITTSSTIDLVLNPYAGVIINPTTLSSAPIGVAVYDIPAASYGWVQTKGPAPVLADGTNAVGADVVASNGTAGAVEDAASPGAQPLVGRCLTGAATGEYGMVLLQLD